MSASFCLDCNKRSECKKICPELEKTLPKLTSGRLRGEHSFDPYYLDYLEKRERGKRVKPKIYNDNWEIRGEEE